MKAWPKHPLRLTGRLIWLASELVLAAVSCMGRSAFRPPHVALAARALWLQHVCRRLLRVFGIRGRVSGPVPSRGILVCNHLSYLDVLVLGACSPAVFMAKQEVKSWPVFGWFASLAGTLFVQRERRTHVGPLTREMETVLDTGVLLVLFPEGTSSDGQTVLPFKSSLLEPAARQTHPLSAGFIQYELEDGDAREEVCYWKDMTLLPHLINLLSKRTVRVSVQFTQLRQGSMNRKNLARQLHAEVLRLKAAIAT